MKKILTMIIAVAIILVNAVVPVYAAETVDYSAYLTELKTLMDRCAAQGIPTDYEMVSYSTIERFNDYINQDLAKGIDTTVTNYEKACIETLYTETKANLEAYLAGSKRAFTVKRPDMNNLSVKGKYVYDGKNPVFSIGYGYFDLAKDDIPNFQDFGVNNIQFEIGPTQTRGQSAPIWYRSGVATANDNVKSYRATNTAVSGNNSLYIQHNDANQAWSYYGVAQNVEIPAGNYTLSFWASGDYAGNMTTILFGDGNWQTHKFDSSEPAGNPYKTTAGANGWTKFEKTVTINNTNTYIRITSDGNTAGFYIDDISLVNNATGEELIKNGSFEEEKNSYIPALEDVKKYLASAEKHNVAVSLLLSPHYFPTGIDGVEYNGQTGFLNYNIDDDPAKAIVEEHIRTVLSEVKDYDAIDSICLSNEPLFDTRWYQDHFTPKFVDFLYDKYGSLANIRTAHGRSYLSDSAIEMPEPINWGIFGTSYTKDARAYDWMEFNNKVFADWHKWMADIVGEYMPNTPVHAKVMENMTHGEGGGRDELSRGTDFDMFGEFLDYSGIDGWNFSEDEYYEFMFTYDYLQSSVGKPVYNSETHNIKDYDGDPSNLDAFTADTTKDALRKMWQGAVHGRSLSTVWLWDREYSDAATNSEFYGGVLFRPDLVDGIGKMNLDLMRLADELVELQENSDKVAIFYSIPSRLYQDSYVEELLTIYKELLANGYDVGVVTEKSIDKLSEYDTLIVPKYATNTTQGALTAIQNFATNGGKVLRGNSSVLTKNELNKSMSPDISNVATYSVSSLPAKTVELKTTSGGSVSNVEWQYSETEDRILVNVTSTTAQNIEVYHNGTKLTNVTELINNETGLTTVSLAANEPKLLEYRLTPESASGEIDIKNLTFDDASNKLYWEGVGEDYAGANVYKYNTDGTVVLLGNTTYEAYSYPGTGTYIVCPVSSNGTEYEGKVITTVAAENSVEISKITEGTESYSIKVDNITGNYLRCKVVVEMLDNDDNVLKYGYSRTFIAPNKSNELKVIMKKPAEFNSAVVYVYDDLNNILASQEIESN